MRREAPEEPFDRLFRTNRGADDAPAYGRLLHAAARAGDPRALFSLGTWTVSGSRALGIRRDRDRAGALVLAGARHFCVAALWAGDWYERGHVLPEDATLAVTWYRRAARLGSIMARHELFRCYSYGIGVAADPAVAARFANAADRLGYEEVADRPTISATYPEPYDRALLRWHDGHRDAECRQLVERGAAAGDGRAQHQLGLWLAAGHRGLGVGADPARARTLLTAAARHVGAAARDLGTWCERGHLVPRDPTQAVAWYRRAARLGSVAARRDLARCYADGLGVAVDRRRAERYLTEVADLDGKGVSGRRAPGSSRPTPPLPRKAR